MKTKLGKVDNRLFDQIMGGHLGYPRDAVRVGAQFGVDVSIIDLPGEMALALTSDPLSLVSSLGIEESAWLSVHLMANDMATTGFSPMYGQFVLNLPATLSQADFKRYWHYIHRFCADIGVSITGGHTGFIPNQNSTIAGGGTFIAVAPKDRILVSANGSPGDTLLVTKSCALSSSAILALSFPETVKNRLGADIYQTAADSFYQTSALPDALAAVGDQQDVTAMHDVTEGGVLGALCELATASGCGAVLHNDKLPIGHAQQQVCSLFSIDPRYCIGAGSMIIACKPGRAEQVISRLHQKAIAVAEIGVLTASSQGIQLIDNDIIQELRYLSDDPYWAAFYTALKNKWK